MIKHYLKRVFFLELKMFFELLVIVFCGFFFYWLLWLEGMEPFMVKDCLLFTLKAYVCANGCILLYVVYLFYQERKKKKEEIK